MWWIPTVIAVAAFLLLILIAPVSLHLEAGNSSLRVFIRFLMIRFTLYPISDSKTGREKKKKKKNPKKDSKPKDEENGPKKKQEPKDILGILEEVQNLLKVLIEHLKRALRIRIYRMRIRVSSDEAAKTALLYSGVCTACGELRNFLKENCNYKEKRDAVEIVPDFTEEKTEAEIQISLGMNVIQALSVGIPVLLQYSNSKNLKGQ